MIHFLTLALLIAVNLELAQCGLRGIANAKVGGTAQLDIPPAANYRRLIPNAKGKEIEHIYRVCNGKNKAKCGYWENTNTKNKMASGTTTYNKNKEMLIIKNVKKTDFGTYMTGAGSYKTDLFEMS